MTSENNPPNKEKIVATKTKRGGRLAAMAEILGDRMLDISRVHLDPRNPRHEPLESDAEVIKQLCDKEHIFELAQDIAGRGSLSPLDALGVIPFEGHPGHYIAVEGNRRTCALILLADPSRSPTPAIKLQFARIAENATAPRKVKVHIFKNREAAKPWIALRHLGPQGGIGTRDWDADQKTRAAGGSKKTSSRANTLALAALDRLVALGLLTPEQRGRVSLTTITRYLGTPGVRAVLGLGSATDLVYTHKDSEVDTALRHLVIDSIEPGDDGQFPVNSRSSSAERLAYASRLKTRGLAPITPMLPTAAPSVPTLTGSSLPTIKQRSARNPSTRATLFDSSFTIVCRDPVLLRLRGEALKLQLDDFPFSGNYLLRALVEQIIVLFVKKRGKYSTAMSDEQLTQSCAAEMKAMGISGKALTIINKAAGSANQPFSLHSLGNTVHGGSVPTRQHLIAMFDTWQPALRAMLDAL